MTGARSGGQVATAAGVGDASTTMWEYPAAAVVRAYRQLLEVEDRFRVIKDFLHLRPVRHWTERRVRGHVAVCVYAAVV